MVIAPATRTGLARPRVPRAADRARPLEEAHPAGYLLFLLLTGVVFIRPAEIVPALLGLPLYELLIAGALLFSLPALYSRLRLRALYHHPGVACVIGLLPAIAASHASHGDFWSARFGALNFCKVLLYYLLLIGLVDSPRRLRVYLHLVAGLILVSAILALARYHGLVELPGIAALTDSRGFDAETGERLTILRLQASGIFSDPNDFSLILGTGVFVAAQVALESNSWLLRLACLAATGVYGYALALTHSRGGFLALLAGTVCFIVARWGVRRAIPVAVAVLPVILVIFAGRQTDIDLGDEGDTAHGRIELWRDGIEFFKGSPFFGIGQGVFVDEAGYVAHNSYIHCYAELGVVGGTLFIGAVFIPMWALWRKALSDSPRIEPQLRRWRPAMLAMLTSYAVGLFSLSRPYSVSTYVILGIAGAFCHLVSQRLPDLAPRLEAALALRVVLAGIACLCVIYAMVKLFA